MKKILILAIMAIAFVGISGLASATTVDTTWDGSGTIYTSIQNSLSKTEITGFGNTFSGEFHGWDNSYDRVEGWAEASYSSGGAYEFHQYNDFTAGAGGEGHIYANTASADGSGFVDVTGDNWRRGNSLKTHGYTGYGWSGTDSPVVGAQSNTGKYSMGIRAYWDQDEDETFESFYEGTINGDSMNYGKAGIGTWKAGSTTILTSCGNIGGNILVYGEGAGIWSQSFYNTGSFDGEFHWA